MDFGDYENALTKFEKAKELHFTPNETYIMMGKCLLEIRKYEDAIENHSAVHLFFLLAIQPILKSINKSPK